jgi:hypothetical protein
MYKVLIGFAAVVVLVAVLIGVLGGQEGFSTHNKIYKNTDGTYLVVVSNYIQRVPTEEWAVRTRNALMNNTPDSYYPPRTQPTNNLDYNLYSVNNGYTHKVTNATGEYSNISLKVSPTNAVTEYTASYNGQMFEPTTLIWTLV